jgi:hypothetical protein
MSRKRREIEMDMAARRALAALLEAGRYSRDGLTTAGARMNRRAVAAGAEGRRRGGAAWSALRGRTSPPRRSAGIVIAVVAGGAAALGARKAIVAWRAGHPESDVTGSLRRVVRLDRPAPASGPAVAADTIEAVPAPDSPPPAVRADGDTVPVAAHPVPDDDLNGPGAGGRRVVGDPPHHRRAWRLIPYG